MLIFDTETTGLIENMTTRFEKQPEVIEFCGLTLDDNGKTVSVYDQLIKPRYPITDEITRMNNITNEMVKDKFVFHGYAEMIRDLIERSDCVVAHNAMFDKDMIDLEFARLKMTKISWPRIICTIEATIHMTGYRLTLMDLHNRLFGHKFSGAHRARTDVEALAKCVVELKKRGEL